MKKIYNIILLLFIANFISAADDPCSAIPEVVTDLCNGGQALTYTADLNNAAASNINNCSFYDTGDRDDFFAVEVGANVSAITIDMSWSGCDGFFCVNNPGYTIYSDPQNDCNNLTVLDCDGDDGNILTVNSNVSVTINPVSPGQIYYIQVWELDDQVGNVDMTITSTPENDFCADALPLTGFGCNYGATNIEEPDDWVGGFFGGTACNGGTWSSIENAVWYEFTVDSNTPQPIDLSVNAIDCQDAGGGGILQMGIWSNTGTCDLNQETFYECSMGSGNSGIFGVTLPEGNYYLFVDGNAGDFCTWEFESPQLICTDAEFAVFDDEENTIPSTQPYQVGCEDTLFFTGVITFDPVDGVPNGGAAPGFYINITTVSGNMDNNTISLYDGPNGSGNLIGTLSPPFGTGDYSVVGTYFEIGTSYSIEWCDNNTNGVFGWEVVSYATGLVMQSGTFDHGANGQCLFADFGPVDGVATYSGPGVENGNDGTGIFVAENANSGINEVKYYFGNGADCLDSMVIQIEVIADQASVSITPDPASACDGETVVYTASPTNGGTTPIYQWYVNGMAIIGETGISFSTNTLNNGDNVYVIMTADPTATCVLGSPATSNTSIYTETASVTPSVSITPDPASACDGDDITFTASGTNGGTTPTYQWYVDGIIITGETGSTFTTNTLNDGQVVSVEMIADLSAVCTDDNPVSDQVTYTETNLTASVTISGTPIPACDGDQVTFTASPTNGGTTPTYQWFLNGNPIVGENGITFTTTTLNNNDVITVVMVADQSATCVVGSPATSNQVTYTETNLPVSVSITPDPASACDGGDITFTAAGTNGGTTPTYQWYVNGTLVLGETGMTFTTNTLNDGDNVYVIMTADPSADCVTGSPAQSNTSDVTVGAISATVSNIIDDSYCNTSCAGSAMINVANSTGTVVYTWPASAGTQNGANGVNLCEGSYDVSVTDDTNCETVVTVTIDRDDALQVTSNITPINCDSDPASIDLEVTGGAPNYTYSWSDDNTITTQDRTGLTPGNYTVTITDDKGCEETRNFEIAPYQEILTLVDPINAECGTLGSIDIEVTGGFGVLTYSWNDGPVTQDRADLPGGTYVLTTTDELGCTRIDSINIDQSVKPVAGITAPTEACEGDIVTFTATGGGTYVWYNGEITTSIDVMVGSDITVSVVATNADGCSSDPATFDVDVEPLPEVSILPNGPVEVCQTSLDLTATGGGTYQWLLNGTPIAGATNDVYTATQSGTYTVEVASSNNVLCTATEDVQVTLNQPNFSTTNDVTNANCSGQNGAIDLTVSPTGNYTYNWSNGATTEDITGLVVGAYNVTISDANGCDMIEMFNITAPNGIAANIAPTNPVCFGDNNGFVDVTISSGGGGYTYTWSNGATTEDLNGVEAGSYIVTITDANGCEMILGTTVDNPAAITVEAGNTVTIDAGEVVDLSASSNDPNAGYDWSNGDAGSQISVSPEETTVYTVTATNADGCVVTDEVTVIVRVVQGGDGDYWAVPNGFTPNDDGRNDQFYIITQGNTEVTEFRVYNRWGEMIYDGLAPWDGTYKGEKQPVGTYVYYGIVRRTDTGETIPLTGDVTLLR